MIRITTGIYKGRKLYIPKNIRPTQNITRKAIFDILGDIRGLSFLDLFAGSGAVGIEAASRRAKEVFFVENNSKVVCVLKKNLTYLSESAYVFFPLDVEVALKNFYKEGLKFDIIFLDPPYPRKGESIAKKTLQFLSSYDILTPLGLVVVQHFKKDYLPEKLGVLNLFKIYFYGGSALSVYEKIKQKPDF